MATRALTIPLSINPRDLIKGLKVSEDAFDDLADAIEDAAEEAEDLPDALDGSKIKNELDKAETAVEGVEDKLEDTGDEAKRTEKAFGKLGSGARADMKKVGSAADKASDDVDDIGKEAGNSAREFGSSFRGDPIEALEEVQSLGAEIAQSTIPGIGGAVAAIGGGILFGFITSQFEQLKEQAEALREKVRELRDEYLELDDVDFANLGEQNGFDLFIEALDDVNVSLEDFQDKVDQTSPKAQELYDAFQQSGTQNDLLAFLDQLRFDLNTVGDEYDGASKSILNDLGDTRTALRDAGDEATFARENFSGVALGLEGVTGTAEEAADAIRGLNDEFVEADEAADNFEAALDETRQSVQELTESGDVWNGTLENNTEAQREGKNTLRDMAEATLDAAAAQIELDGSTEAARKTTQRGRKAVVDAGVAMGLSREEAEKYADKLGLIPGDVSTDLNINSTTGMSAIEAYQQALDGIPDSITTKLQIQQTLEGSIGGSLAGDQSGLPQAQTGTQG